MPPRLPGAAFGLQGAELSGYFCAAGGVIGYIAFLGLAFGALAFQIVLPACAVLVAAVVVGFAAYAAWQHVHTPLCEN